MVQRTEASKVVGALWADIKDYDGKLFATLSAPGHISSGSLEVGTSDGEQFGSPDIEVDFQATDTWPDTDDMVARQLG